MKKQIVFILFMFLICLLTAGYSPAVEPNPSAKYIQRTMKALEESTAQNPAYVRVLFYGQSIVQQEWTVEVQKELQKRYPTAKFTFKNSAIGGYTSPALIRTAESDLYPWYPDLLFFHVYGDLKKYEQIIQNTRERTSAEIVIWTSHLSANQDPNAMTAHRDERSQGILAVAERQHCMIIDLNKKWCDLLVSKGWKASDLLRDTVHLKPEGCAFYASFIAEELVRLPGHQGVESASGTIKTIPLNDSSVKKNADGSMTLSFSGNRVCAVSNGKGTQGASASVLLDGQPMNGQKDLWAFTRPSVGPAWMPAVNCINRNSTWVKEQWTLTALPDSAKDGSRIHYRVEGSITGPDGEGVSDKDFVSNSGRVLIAASDFAATGQFKYFKKSLPDNFKVTWSNYPLFADPYLPTEKGTRTVLVQNCSNGSHVLTIIPKNGDPGIECFIVNAPVRR